MAIVWRCNTYIPAVNHTALTASVLPPQKIDVAETSSSCFILLRSVRFTFFNCKFGGRARFLFSTITEPTTDFHCSYLIILSLLSHRSLR